MPKLDITKTHGLMREGSPWLLTTLLVIILLLGSITVSRVSFAKDPVIIESVLVSEALGTYRLEIAGNEKDQYLITVFDGNGRKIETFNVVSSVPVNSMILAIDVDGDGYKDLVITNSYGAGPFPVTSLYRFNPNKKLFELDDSFPGDGFPTPSRERGCVYLQGRRAGGYADYYYVFTEWCLSLSDKTWFEGRSCDSHSVDNCPTCNQPITIACYNDLDDYQKKWWAKQKE